MDFAVVGEVIAGRYELQELVGTGGMSNVYRAHDRLLERTVALKLLHDRYSDDDEYVERFRREARAAARLSHPNIVTVIDRGEQNGRQFIVFEHVAGENLKQLVTRSGPLPIRQAIELALQIGRALSFAHEHELVHRDVKPQNVLLNGDGRAKVTDFGIARTLDVEGVTQSGVVLGTSHYISPEQATGDSVDAQSDVYSLGAVVYELLTGDVPFPGDNFVTVAMRHVREPVPSVLEERPEVPLRLAAAVERALAKGPTDRFGSMHEFVNELEACHAQLGEEGEFEPTLIVRRPTVKESRRRAHERERRRWWPLVLLLAVLAIAAIVAGVLLFRVAASDDGSSSRPVHLRAVAIFDPPPGDGYERDDLITNATDRDPETYWETERYYDEVLTKPGVGLVLDARRRSEPSKLTITSSTPGFRAVVREGNGVHGPFPPSQTISKSQTVGSRATFDLEPKSPSRYFLVWITNLGGQEQVRINEVKAS
jgi:eukaryotic-like serine/threonine-protein kinase